MHRTFPKVGTYNRFVELGNKMAILSALFTTNVPLGKLKFRRQRSFTDMQKYSLNVKESHKEVNALGIGSSDPDYI